MLEKFISDIRNVYRQLENGVTGTMEGFLKTWGLEGDDGTDVGAIGDKYQELCHVELKKDMGSFYTPGEVVDFMVRDSLKELDYAKDPFIRILDPSCGGGYFLRSLYKALLPLAITAGIENAREHVVRFNLFGCDVDEIAVMITCIELFRLSGTVSKNIALGDFLLDYDPYAEVFDRGEGVDADAATVAKGDGFDLVLGNPPYMGHKILTGEYRRQLYDRYADVFYDKADFSYCFIRRSIELLKEQGRLMFFTSRYIVEALNGNGVRKYLLNNGHIRGIIDFYGIRVIKGVRVDNIILDFCKNVQGDGTRLIRLNPEAEEIGKGVLELLDQKPAGYFRITTVRQTDLEETGFSFLEAEERRILDKISGRRLSDICMSHQGIITGCDKAFVISKNDRLVLGKLDHGLLFNWIKGKNISRFQVTDAKEYLIYTNLLKEDENERYKETLEYIGKYRERLEKRRECRKGSRKWYELQWSRTLKLFQTEKIIYPYKASENRFAIDKGNCFSADVYALRLNEDEGSMSHEFLCAVLNSSLYEFYIKSIAKKLGRDLYEYYPNKIMQLRVPELIPGIEEEARRDKPDRRSIDNMLNAFFGITEQEYQIIRRWCKSK